MTAVEIAIEALKQFADPNNWSLKPGCLQWTGKRNAIEYAESIVAALTAEPSPDPNYGARLIAGKPLPSPVPPDRERNTGLVCDAESYLRQTGQTVYADAVASLLRQPAPAEVEAMIARLLGPTSPSELRQDAAALLRRLALPAVGDWRDIASAPKAPIDSRECWDILAWYPNGVIEVMYWSNGWWPSNLDADEPWDDPHLWMPMPGAPPIPEEPKP